jgi:hypothetical protein
MQLTALKYQRNKKKIYKKRQQAKTKLSGLVLPEGKLI